MFLKLGAFVLLSLGALAVLGMIGAAMPSIGTVAMHIGEHAVTYGNLLFVGALGCVLYITSKV